MCGAAWGRSIAKGLGGGGGRAAAGITVGTVELDKTEEIVLALLSTLIDLSDLFPPLNENIIYKTIKNKNTYKIISWRISYHWREFY